MIKQVIILFIISFTMSYLGVAQVSINTDGSSSDPSAMLDVQSTNKGLLIPRMDSTSRQNILNAADGLMVYDSTTHSFWYYRDDSWKEMNAESASIISDMDGDTKIQVEKNADEDSIRIDVAGSERMVIKQSEFGNTLISLPNNN